ncbi:type VII secretion system-associated protein (plasmid) [Streptomyces atratus]|uniref:Type VII secretion system-associated protein n=1 Tax=Streptomyces atratus TaxID=1893 RepID=A0A1K2F717_STRAR|nr:type VII secretion system-associated protein [Streptomyces atratus]SFY43052.1 hypothetical protein SAMN02787144_103329 [Streptomyces atratus]
MADLTKLDAKGLQTFVDNDVADFMKDLEDIRKDAPGIPALKSLARGDSDPDHLMENPVFSIGPMGLDDSLVPGKKLIAQAGAGAGAIDKVLAEQRLLFRNMDRNLRETIRTLLKSQGDSLESIGGQKLLDIFSDSKQ